MESINEALRELGLIGFVIAFCLNWTINSFALWVVLNYMMSVEGGAPLKKCFLCTLGLTVWTILVILGMIFIPIPLGLLALLIWLVVWYFGSRAIIEGTFELLEGALTILILYFVVSSLIFYLLESALGG